MHTVSLAWPCCPHYAQQMLEMQHWLFCLQRSYSWSVLCAKADVKTPKFSVAVLPGKESEWDSGIVE